MLSGLSDLWQEEKLITLKTCVGNYLLSLRNRSQEHGFYSAEFSPQEGGPFEIAIDAPEHDRELETKLTVSLPKREKLGRPVNRPVLAEIASITGGESAGTDQLDQLIKKISVLPEPKPAEIRTRLWSNPWWGGAILLLLVVYWTGRKLAGLV